MTDQPFPTLFAQVRGGDPAAAEQLVRMYEPEIRRVVRVRLTDSRLRRMVDSVDICQSVLAGFFVRTAAGQYDPQTPEEMLRLLVTMAKNRIVDLARYAQAERRDSRRDVAMEDSHGYPRALPADRPGPESIVVNRELVDRVRDRLADGERIIMQRRSDGQSWDEIGEALGQNGNTLRMKLARALDRVTAELGLESSDG
ncbi:MAG: sigma-70 family RNA polymerase sigma factor [Planctomycetaceae bacterium]|nr:sigma-70 family RNA polymerase sigma factor [Planctomycetaceae bacterium]